MKIRNDLRGGFILVVGLWLFSGKAWAGEPLEKVRVQLSWQHQFQFAGFYAAVQQGFYRRVGLDVVLIEGRAGLETPEMVLAQQAEYGVSGPGLLILRAKGQPLVAMGAIFQRSPTLLITRSELQILSPHDLIGKRVMMVRTQRNAEVLTMLVNEGVSLDALQWVHPQADRYEQFQQGQIDALVGFITEAPYQLQQRQIPYHILQPINYGIDFYGDVFFTTENEVKHHPARALAFCQATLEGWRYAMTHVKENIDLILNQYNRSNQHTREALEYEAQKMQELIMPDLVQLGHMNPGRWQRIAELYQKLGFIQKADHLDGFLYETHSHSSPEMTMRELVMIGFGGGGMAIGLLLFFNRQLKREILKRQEAEKEVEKTLHLLENSVQERTEELKRSHEESQKQSQFLEAILQSMGNGLVVVDEQGKALIINNAAQQILGNDTFQKLLPEQWIHYYQLSHADGVKPLKLDEIPLVRAMKGESVMRAEICMRVSYSERPVHLHVNAQPVKLPSGQLIGALAVFEDISQRKVAQEQLQIYAHKLEQSNQELNDFAYITSHDLKEPVRGMRMFAQILIADYASKLDNEGAKMLQTLDELAERMMNLIDSLLKYAQVGQVELAMQKTDLNGVIEDVLMRLRPLLQTLAVKIEVPRPLPIVSCDHVRVGEVFYNLITNAIKYTESPDKWVEIGWLEEWPEVRKEYGNGPFFYVKDHGIGIREKHLEVIFRVFKRLHGRDKFGGGTGMGLTFARRIVERHGGRIWAQSIYGQGSTFYFTLSAADRHSSQPA